MQVQLLPFSVNRPSGGWLSNLPERIRSHYKPRLTLLWIWFCNTTEITKSDLWHPSADNSINKINTQARMLIHGDLALSPPPTSFPSSRTILCTTTWWPAPSCSPLRQSSAELPKGSLPQALREQRLRHMRDTDSPIPGGGHFPRPAQCNLCTTLTTL